MTNLDYKQTTKTIPANFAGGVDLGVILPEQSERMVSELSSVFTGVQLAVEKCTLALRVENPTDTIAGQTIRRTCAHRALCGELFVLDLTQYCRIDEFVRKFAEMSVDPGLTAELHTAASKQPRAGATPMMALTYDDPAARGSDAPSGVVVFFAEPTGNSW